MSIQVALFLLKRRKNRFYASERRRSHPSAVSTRPLGRWILIGSKGFDGLTDKEGFFWGEAGGFFAVAFFLTAVLEGLVVFLTVLGAVFSLGAAFFLAVFVERVVVFFAEGVFFLTVGVFFLEVVFFLAVFVERVVVFFAGEALFLGVVFFLTDFLVAVFLRPKSFFKIIAPREEVSLPFAKNDKQIID